MDQFRPLAPSYKGERPPVPEPKTQEEQFFGMDAESSVTVSAGALQKSAEEQTTPSLAERVAAETRATAERELGEFATQETKLVAQLGELQTARAALDAQTATVRSALEAVRAAKKTKAAFAGLPETGYPAAEAHA